MAKAKPRKSLALAVVSHSREHLMTSWNL